MWYCLISFKISEPLFREAADYLENRRKTREGDRTQDLEWNKSGYLQTKNTFEKYGLVLCKHAN